MKRNVLICSGILVLALAISCLVFRSNPREDRAITAFHGGAIVRDFFDSGFNQYLLEHHDIPEAWKKLSFLPNTMDEPFGQRAGSFWSDVSFLPGSKKTPDGIENFRVWFLDEAERAKTRDFFYQSPYVPQGTTASLEWPMAWVVYKEKGRTIVAVLSWPGVMPADDFIPFLQSAMNYAKAHSIHYDPAQLDYIRKF